MKKAKAPWEDGRVKLLPLAFGILIVGLWMDRWWWQIGFYVIITIFVLAFLKYRGPAS